MRRLILYPDPVLAQKCTPYGKKQKPDNDLMSEMFAVMSTCSGLGLAAPQVGETKRVIVLFNPLKGKGLCIFNPEYFPVGEEMDYTDEGCLSLPGVFVPISRYKKIHVKAFKGDTGEPVEFEAEALLAKIIQHEIDHLDGMTMLDRMDVLTQARVLEDMENKQKEMAYERR